MSTQDAIESTRRYASDAMERASDSMRDLRSDMSGRAAAARASMGEYAGVGRQYVNEHPLQSALIAAAIGAAVAGLILALRHRRDMEDLYF